MDSLVCTVDNCRVFNLPRLIETSLSGSANTKRLMDKAGRRLLRAQAEYAVGIGTAAPVSYTHLDVYKRQSYPAAPWIRYGKSSPKTTGSATPTLCISRRLRMAWKKPSKPLEKVTQYSTPT